MLKILIQRAYKHDTLPSNATIREWAKQALRMKTSDAEMTIRIVDSAEMTALNTTYRHKAKPTNVLSFPFDMPAEITLDTPLLGDIIICAPVVAEEAAQQHKPLEAHWAHMVIHGSLHLLGFDHEEEEAAIIMESHETTIMTALGYPDPYFIAQGNTV